MLGLGPVIEVDATTATDIGKVAELVSLALDCV
jgi:hypothetical protein